MREASFTAPDGSDVPVQSSGVFCASAHGDGKCDGAGLFAVTPSAWLSLLQQGTWTVHVVGNTSGIAFDVPLVLGQ